MAASLLHFDERSLDEFYTDMLREIGSLGSLYQTLSVVEAAFPLIKSGMNCTNETHQRASTLGALIIRAEIHELISDSRQATAPGPIAIAFGKVPAAMFR
jgi:hypothetical protein